MGQSDFAPKRVKKGYFFGQNSIFELVFTFFQKNRVVSRKDSSNKHIPWRNTKFGQGGGKKRPFPPPKFLTEISFENFYDVGINFHQKKIAKNIYLDQTKRIKKSDIFDALSLI